MHELVILMLFPVFNAHMCFAKFQYSDLTWKEMCGQMAHLVADSGGNKGQLGNLVEAICRDYHHFAPSKLQVCSEETTTLPGAKKKLHNGVGSVV